MADYLQTCISLLFTAIEAVSGFFETVIGEFGLVLVAGSGMALIVYRFLIKPITGYGVGSDTARPKKDEKGE